MKNLTKILALIPLLGITTLVQAAPVTLGNWAQTGGDIDNTFTGNGTAGFTELYGAETQDPARPDSGARADFASDVTLDATTNQLRFSFTVGSITASGAANNAFRVGFENDDPDNALDSTVHYIFGWGGSLDARFAGKSADSNEYSQGTAIDTDSNVAGATPLATGNTSNITVTLTYLGIASPGVFNYQAEIDWDGVIHTSSTFTRSTTTWDKVYVLTNTGAVNILGNTYTISNAEVSTSFLDVDPFGLLAWVETGNDADNTFTGNGNLGFTELFGTESQDPARLDSGARASFKSKVTLDDTLNTLEFSFTVGAINSAGGGANAGFRVGFENDAIDPNFDATMHFMFGYGDANPSGDRIDARFAGNSFDNNEYAQGTHFDINFEMTGVTPLNTGNTSNITVSLTYLGEADSGLFYYRAKIVWDGVTHTSGVFTRNTNTWDRVHVLTNNGAVNVAGGTFTVSGTEISLSTDSITDYDEWSGPNGLNLVQGPGGDDDKDGLSNYQEYVFGLDPFDPSSLSPITEILSKSTGLFSYTRRNTTAFSTGQSYIYEYSTTLENPWTTFTPDVDPPATDSGNPVETVTVDLPDELLANPALFIRVRVE